MILTSAKHFQQPRKIISLVPSITELLYYLELEKEVTGITKFCVHPKEWMATKTRIGGTKNINLALIKKLQPDLIIANKEENVKEQIEELSSYANVWVTDVKTLDEALIMISDIGELTHKTMQACTLIGKIKTNFTRLLPYGGTNDNKIKSAYIIWQHPYMSVGGDTFINDMMQHCGLQNIFHNKTRYPKITLDDLAKEKCKLILLSSEPYPFKQIHIEELQKALPGKKIILVDGEMFSWYGSRLLKAPEYFTTLLKSLHP